MNRVAISDHQNIYLIHIFYLRNTFQINLFNEEKLWQAFKYLDVNISNATTSEKMKEALAREGR